MLDIGVVGIGRMGGFHSAKVVQNPDTNLKGIYDLADISEKAGALGTKAYKDIDALIADSDAIVLSSPTTTHFEIGKKILSQGKHLLVEKPVAASIEEAEEMVRLAENNGLVLSVGHIENFNPAFLAAYTSIDSPIFVEAHRLTPFAGRGTDVSVVMDLMIHDIEILLRLMGSVKEIRASGASILTDEIDIASARIEFESGVANVTASRISDKPMRKMRFFTKGSYISVDFGDKVVEAIARGSKDSGMVFEMGGEKFTKLPFLVEDKDPLYEELSDFVKAIKGETEPMVKGRNGLEALRIAESIIKYAQR